MKKLIIATLCLFSVNAMALNSNSSWKEIFADNDARFSHFYGEATSIISLENVCVTADEVRSIAPVSVCAKYETRTIDDGEGRSYEQTECVEYTKKQVSLARNFDRTVCAKWENVTDDEGRSYNQCVATEIKKVYLPATIEVSVWEVNDESNSFPGFLKSYTFPACSR